MFSVILTLFSGATALEQPTKIVVGCINESVSNLPGAAFPLADSLKDIEWQIAQKERGVVTKGTVFELSLADNNIDDGGITEICKFITCYFRNTSRHLRAISLANNRITNVGVLNLLRTLQDFQDLEEIDFSINYIDNQSLLTDDLYLKYMENKKTIIL